MRDRVLNPRRGNEAVEALVWSRDLKSKGVELFGVSNVAFCRGCGVSMRVPVLYKEIDHALRLGSVILKKAEMWKTVQKEREKLQMNVRA